MAFTFPLTWSQFAGRLRINAGRFDLARFEEASGTSRGDVLTRSIAWPKWQTEVGLVPMRLAEASEIEAILRRLGSSGTFYMHDPRHPFPQMDPAGLLLGAATPTIHSIGGDNRSMRLAGLPNGYQLRPGDTLSFDRGSSPVRRSFHSILEPVAASAAGLTPAFEVEPPFQAGTVAAADVTLLNPAAKMQITSFSPGEADAARFNVHGMAFTAIEAF